MIIKKFYFLGGLAIVSFTSPLFSQNTSVGGAVNTNNGRVFLSPKRTINPSEIIDGSPYYNGDDFKKVSISGYSNNVQDLRYNSYSDEMEFLNGNEVFTISKEAGMIINFTGINKIYECINYNWEGRNKFGYLVQLVNNPEKYSLYKKERTELLKGEKSPNGITKDRNDYYVKDKDTYILKNKEEFISFPKNKKEFINKFNNSQIESYLKQNDINFKKESDLIKLISYMNTL